MYKYIVHVRDSYNIIHFCIIVYVCVCVCVCMYVCVHVCISTCTGCKQHRCQPGRVHVYTHTCMWMGVFVGT